MIPTTLLSNASTSPPRSALPEITSPVIIDGWSQPGFAGSPLVELDGSTASEAIDGLLVRSLSNTIRGLVLHGFTTAIRLESDGGNVIQGNFIGTDSTGTNAAGNFADGILVNSPGNLIGGTAPGVANIISGNASNGVVFATANARTKAACSIAMNASSSLWGGWSSTEM